VRDCEKKSAKLFSFRGENYFTGTAVHLDSIAKGLWDRQEINFTVCQGKSCSDLDDFSAADGLVSLCKEKSSRNE